MKGLIVDDIHPVFLERMAAIGVEVDYKPTINRINTEQIMANYELLVVRSKFRIDQSFLAVSPKLKVIARAGAGMDNIDEAYALRRGIVLINAPEGNRDAVGEHLIGMLLALMNRLTFGNREIREGVWLREENRGVELGGRTVGLIGYGNNGGAMARKLAGFGVKVLAYDKYKAGFSDAYAKEASLEELFEEADVLSLHIPLTEESREMVNAAFLRRFRKPIYFLNGARGEIVAVSDVLDALDEGRILGAAFDVLPVEKFPALLEADWYQRLILNDKVLLSPHVAGWTVESYRKIAEVLADKIASYMAK